MQKKILILVAFLSLKMDIFAQTPPSSPDLEFVCELKVKTAKAMTLGETAHGLRRFIDITGGTFEGPKMKGIVLKGGADYQFVNKTNTRTEIEAIYTIRTDDSVLIHIRNVGLSLKTLENAAKLAKGEPMDVSKNYFRAAPKFEAPNDSRYDWLNNAIFVCKGIPTNQGYVIIQVWKVL
ncbi:MAG: hypothetical protein RIS64_2967 [Bacteroidota bacterium]|jgi:hypothetical protein